MQVLFNFFFKLIYYFIIVYLFICFIRDSSAPEEPVEPKKDIEKELTGEQK